MWALLLDTASSTILELSMRAIVGAALAIFILLIVAALFKRNEDVKEYIFVLVLAVVFFASAILFATAIVHLQDKLITAAMALGLA